MPGFLLGQPGAPALQVALTPLGPSSPPQGQIYVDPQNVTGVANDNAPPNQIPGGQTIAGPVFRTWRGLVAAWGTLFPVFNATTTIVFLSSHTDITDPVVLFPILLGSGVSCVIRGTSTIVATVTLANVVSKSRAAGANSLLQANLGASAAQGMFVQNTTHVGNCWVYKALGGSNFSLTQPMAPQSTGSTTLPSEVDTFANGDVVNLLTFTQINITCFVATSVDGIGPGGFGEIQQCVILNPTGTFGPCALGQSTNVRETSCQRLFINALETAFAPTLLNVILLGSNAGTEGMFALRGGAAISGLFGLGGFGVSAAIVDADCIIGAPGALFKGNVQAGHVFLDNGGGNASLAVFEGQVLQATNYGNPPVWYGAPGANIKVVRNGRMTLGTGASFTTQWTAPGLVSPGVLINGSSTAESHTNAAPDVINGGIATTVANLDAAAGATGFGGSAFNLSTGAGVSNQNS